LDEDYRRITILNPATGEIPMDMTASYGQFAHIHLSPQGIVKSEKPDCCENLDA